jgi:heat shock protein HtpX
MITTYDYIESNNRKTILLILLFPLSLLFILFVLFYLSVLMFPQTGIDNNQSVISQVIDSYWIYFVICIVLSCLWTVISFFQGNSIILNSVKAVKADKADIPDKEITRILENVSITAGIQTPNLYILDNEKGLNAFAVGTRKTNSAVILTKGLIETLDKSELEAVIAHEVAHIIHQDTKLMVVLALLIGFFTYFGSVMFKAQAVSGRRRSSSSSKSSKGGGIIILIALAFLIYGYIVAPLLRLAVSRTREFEADAKSALLTRNPQALISALKKIQKHPIVDRFNSEFNNNELVAPMCIESPLRIKVSLFDSLSKLSSTHPPIEERIKALEVMDGRNLDF